jgi:hypothetical protein
MINGYTETSERWARRNDLHVRMVEQAGEDRVLFQNTKPHDHVDMKFPEYVAFLLSPVARTLNHEDGATMYLEVRR